MTALNVCFQNEQSLKEIVSCRNFVKHMGSRILRKIHVVCVKTIIQFDNQNYIPIREDKKNIESAKIRFLAPSFIYNLNWIKCKVKKTMQNS